MRLHVVYRTTGGGNSKARPPWFSKRAALASLLAAVEQVPGPVDLTYVVDGGLPDGVGDLVGDARQVHIRGGRASSSLRKAVDVALEVSAGDQPVLLWLAEDDYLYHPRALAALVEAEQALPEAAYFALYVPDNSAWHATHPSQPERGVPELPGGPREVGGVTWRRVADTTSTIGVRRETLLQDRRQTQLCTFTGSPFDHATYHSLQGTPPYSWRHLLCDLDVRPGLRGRSKLLTKPAMRVVVNLSARTQRGKGRVVVAPTEDLATHIELGFVSPSQDWPAIAASLA